MKPVVKYSLIGLGVVTLGVTVYLIAKKSSTPTPGTNVDPNQINLLTSAIAASAGGGGNKPLPSSLQPLLANVGKTAVANADDTEVYQFPTASSSTGRSYDAGDSLGPILAVVADSSGNGQPWYQVNFDPTVLESMEYLSQSLIGPTTKPTVVYVLASSITPQ